MRFLFLLLALMLAACTTTPSNTEQSTSPDGGETKDAPPVRYCGDQRKEPCPEEQFCCRPGVPWATNCTIDTCVARPVVPPVNPPPHPHPFNICEGFGRCDTDADCDKWSNCFLDKYEWECTREHYSHLPKSGYCWRSGCYSNADCETGKTCKSIVSEPAAKLCQ